MSMFYKNNFIFYADRYEEWMAGRCISQGNIKTEIIAEVVGNKIIFQLDNIGDIRMSIPCSFDIMGEDYCILHDRIQYLNNDFDGESSIEPVICNIFYKIDKIEYVRFAMTNPDRLVEFYGNVNVIGQKSSMSVKPSKEQIQKLVNVISHIQNQFSEIAKQVGDAARGFQLNQMFETFKLPLYLAWRGYNYGWHTDFMEEGDSLFPIMMFEADVLKNTQELIDMLETNSPFANVEKNSAITTSLISVYKSFIYDIKNENIKL